MQPKFLPPEYGCPATLLCPACGSINLHHESVEVYERKEDEEGGVHVLVKGGTVTMDRHLDGNPSSRRHGLRVEFSCEQCAARPVLTIAQHKGETHVDFTFAP